MDGSGSRGDAARQMALRLLDRRMHTRRELFSKLAERWGEEEAESAVRRMEELGFIDDRDYARRFAADAEHLRGQGELRIARALAEKGVGREIIEEVLAERERDPEPLIAEILLRKYRRYLADERGRAQAAQALARLGWRYEDIRAALRNLAEDEEYYNRL